MALDRETFYALTPAGKLLGLTYVKADGVTTLMNVRTGVSKGVTGVGKAYSDEDKGLVTLYDMNREGHRSLRPERILEIRCGGKVIYKAEPDE